MKYLFLVLFTLFPLSSHAVSLQPENLLNANLSVVITVDLNSGFFTYNYQLKNLSTSQQSIWSFIIPLLNDKSGNTVQNLKSPVEAVGQIAGNISGDNEFGTAVISWVIVSNGNYPDESQPPPGILLPNQSLGGFSFQTMDLPTIQNFYARGWVPDVTEDEALQYFNQLSGKQYTNLEEVPDNLIQQSPLGKTIPQKAFTGTAIGPQVIPSSQLQPIPLLQRLISLKDQTRSLRWIDNAGVANSLDQKLKNALDDLNKGNTQSAVGILGAFVNDLNAQHGKHVNDNAFALLNANAQYILVLLTKS